MKGFIPYMVRIIQQSMVYDMSFPYPGNPLSGLTALSLLWSNWRFVL